VYLSASSVAGTKPIFRGPTWEPYYWATEAKSVAVNSSLIRIDDDNGGHSPLGAVIDDLVVVTLVYVPPDPPQFLSMPAGSAVCGRPYRYSSSGSPAMGGTAPFTFSLLAAPDQPLPEGISVDPATGDIAWTPAFQPGTVHFLLKASNDLFEATQDVSIEVECPVVLRVGAGCSAAMGAPKDPLAVMALAFLLTRGRQRRK
jgi:putative Ig domain-containing protein